MAGGLFRIKTVDGTKQIQSLAGTEIPHFPSLPVGAVIGMYTTTVPTGYLPCNGAEYDTDQFPLLYAVLGTNKLPDLRECVLVGAGTNDTDTIETHDIYTINQFKDDQIQNITGETRNLGVTWTTGDSSGIVTTTAVGGYDFNGFGQGSNSYGKIKMSFDASKVARTGTNTHGKQKGIFYVIKATSNINDAESNAEITSVLGNYASKSGLNYSNSEIDTGSTWIDGKNIYKTTIDCDFPATVTEGTISSERTALSLNIESLVKTEALAIDRTDGYVYTLPRLNSVCVDAVVDNDGPAIEVQSRSSSWNNTNYLARVTVYYTKGD